MLKRLMAFAIALLLAAAGAFKAGAAALPSPVGQLMRAPALSADITAQVKAWPDLSETTLAAFQSWLASARLAVLLRKEGSLSLAALYDGAGEVFSAQTRTEGQSAQMTLRVGTGLAPTRYLGSASLPPWRLLFDGLPALPNLPLALEALEQIGQAALVRLKPFEKDVKRSITIKNAGRGASQKTYSLKKAEAGAFWEVASPELLPLFDRLFDALLMGQAETASAALQDARMAGPLTVKRYLREDGGDLGLQVTASLQTGGQTRRLTLYGGISDSGLYLSFKLPAARGRDTIEFQVSALFKGDGLRGDWRMKLVSGARNLRAEGEIDLDGMAAAAGLAIKGSLNANITFSGETKKTLKYLFMPDLLLEGETLTGTLGVQETSAGKLLRDVQLAFTPAREALSPLSAQAEVDLLSADPKQLVLARERILSSLLPGLKGFLLGLDREARPLVLHDLGRERRTQGESVSPINNTDGLFTVTDHLPDEPTKEDTP